MSESKKSSEEEETQPETPIEKEKYSSLNKQEKNDEASLEKSKSSQKQEKNDEASLEKSKSSQKKEKVESAEEKKEKKSLSVENKGSSPKKKEIIKSPCMEKKKSSSSKLKKAQDVCDEEADYISENEEEEEEEEEDEACPEGEPQKKSKVSFPKELEKKSKKTPIEKCAEKFQMKDKMLEEKLSDLKSKVKEIMKEHNDSKKLINEAFIEYEKYEEVVCDMSEQEDLLKENDVLKCKIFDLLSAVQCKLKMDDGFFKQINCKLDEWRKLIVKNYVPLTEHVDEISQLKKEIKKLNKKLSNEGLMEINEEMEEKDKQIKELSDKLVECEKELCFQETFMEEMRKMLAEEKTKDSTVPNSQVTKNLFEEIRNCKKIQALMLTQLQNIGMLYGRCKADLSNVLRENSNAMEQLYDRSMLEERNSKLLKFAEKALKHSDLCKVKMEEMHKELNGCRRKLFLEPRPKLEIDYDYDTEDMAVQLRSKKSLTTVLLELKEEVSKTSSALEIYPDEKIVIYTGEEEYDNILRTMYRNLKSFMAEEKESNIDSQKLQHYADELLKEKGFTREQLAEYYENEIKKLKKEIDNLNGALNDLDSQNQTLLEGFDELKDMLKDSPNQKNPVIMRAISKLIELLKVKDPMTSNEKVINLKGETQRIKGQNEELRKELKELKMELGKQKENYNKVLGLSIRQRVKFLECETALKAPSFYPNPKNQPLMSLPSDLTNETYDVINALNEELMHVLQEISIKDECIRLMTSDMEKLRNQYQVAIQQQYLIYKEFNNLKTRKNEENLKLKKSFSNLKNENEDKDTKMKEMENLFNILRESETNDDLCAQISEATRKNIQLQNENETFRRQLILLKQENSIKKSEIERMKSESFIMEKSIEEKLSYFAKAKVNLTYRAKFLEKELENSVTLHEYNRVMYDHFQLLEKYRILIDKTTEQTKNERKYLAYMQQINDLKAEVDNLNNAVNEEKLKKKMIEVANNFINKSTSKLTVDEYIVKLNDFIMEKEASPEINTNINNCLTYFGTNISYNNPEDEKDKNEEDQPVKLKLNTDLLSLFRNMTIAEMREMNQKQKNELAQSLNLKLKDEVRAAEERIEDLENKLTELTTKFLESKNVEQSLLNEMQNAVPNVVYQKSQADLNEAEKKLELMQIDNDRLKKISDIALNQIEALHAERSLEQLEEENMKEKDKRNIEDDSKTVIAYLHNRVVSLQVADNYAKKKQRNLMSEISKYKAISDNFEKKLEEEKKKNKNIGMEYFYKMKHLNNILNYYKEKYVGVVPLSEMENFKKASSKLEEDKAKVEEYLEKAKENEEALKLEKSKNEEMTKGLKELEDTLKNSSSSVKMVEWHKKMEELRHQITFINWDKEKLKESLATNERILMKLELEKKLIEDEKVNLIQDFEKWQIQSEKNQRNLEISLLKCQSELKNYSDCLIGKKVELPDPSLPLEQRLEKAEFLIKQLDNKNCHQENLIKKNKEEISQLTDKVAENELELKRKDEEINDLKAKLPDSKKKMISVDEIQDIIFKNIDDEEKKNLLNAASNDNKDKIEKLQNIYQTAIDDLNSRLQNKEHTISHYKKLLEQQKQKAVFEGQQHLLDLQKLQQQADDYREKSTNALKNEILEAVKAAGQSDNDLNDPCQASLKKKEKALEALTRRLDQMETEKLSMEEKITNLEEEVKTQKKKYNDFVEEAKTKEAHCDFLKKELTKRIQQSKDKNFEYKQDNIRMATLNLKNQQLISELRSKLTSAQNSYKELQFQSHEDIIKERCEKEELKKKFGSTGETDEKDDISELEYLREQFKKMEGWCKKELKCFEVCTDEEEIHPCTLLIKKYKEDTRKKLATIHSLTSELKNIKKQMNIEEGDNCSFKDEFIANLTQQLTASYKQTIKELTDMNTQLKCQFEKEKETSDQFKKQYLLCVDSKNRLSFQTTNYKNIIIKLLAMNDKEKRGFEALTVNDFNVLLNGPPLTLNSLRQLVVTKALHASPSEVNNELTQQKNMNESNFSAKTIKLPYLKKTVQKKFEKSEEMSFIESSQSDSDNDKSDLCNKRKKISNKQNSNNNNFNENATSALDYEKIISQLKKEKAQLLKKMKELKEFNITTLKQSLGFKEDSSNEIIDSDSKKITILSGKILQLTGQLKLTKQEIVQLKNKVKKQANIIEILNEKAQKHEFLHKKDLSFLKGHIPNQDSQSKDNVIFSNLKLERAKATPEIKNKIGF